jgi:hypothetical protein
LPWLAVALAAEVIAYVGYTIGYREIVRAERGADLEVPKAVALVATGFGVFLQEATSCSIAKRSRAGRCRSAAPASSRRSCRLRLAG